MPNVRPVPATTSDGAHPGPAHARYSAADRLRDLCREISDIGDEVATYIDNVAEAVADWDWDLVVDCLEELGVIIDEAREDVRPATNELAGIRTALTSGLRSGHLSAGLSARERAGRGPAGTVAHPDPLTTSSLEEKYPVPTGVVDAAMVGEVLTARTELVSSYCAHVAQWVEDQTNLALVDVQATNLSLVFAQAQRMVDTATSAWEDTVVQAYPPFTRMMRGSCPPAFLAERARVDAIVARVAASRQAAKGKTA